MRLSSEETLIIIFAVTLGTVLTRFIPFFLFPDKKDAPKIISYLGKVLPPAMMGLLVVYCLKDISFLSKPYGIPEALAILMIIILHQWKNNVLLSIAGGTILYMVLIQVFFL